MFHTHALKVHLNLCNRTNKCTGIKYILSHIITNTFQLLLKLSEHIKFINAQQAKLVHLTKTTLMLITKAIETCW